MKVSESLLDTAREVSPILNREFPQLRFTPEEFWDCASADDNAYRWQFVFDKTVGENTVNVTVHSPSEYTLKVFDNPLNYSVDDLERGYHIMFRAQGNYGSVNSLEWFKNGKKHRDVGAAVIKQPHNERATYEYYQHGMLHNPIGYAQNQANPGYRRNTQMYAIWGHKFEPRNRIDDAVSPLTPPAKLARMTHYQKPEVAYFAAHNPNCPEEARIEYSLLREHEFACPR